MTTCSISLSSTDKNMLTMYINFLIRHFKLKSWLSLPNKKKQYTILKAPHIHKKSRDQYQLIYYKELVYFEQMSHDTYSKFRYLLVRTIPANLKLKVHLVQKV